MSADGKNGANGANGQAGGPPRRLGREERVLPKRFYKDVGVGAVDAGFQLLLDGRAAKTPKKSPLLLPTEALAEAIASEWLAQGAHIEPDTMPLTRIANTALDGVTGNEALVAADIVKYAGSDLLCYRAEQPRELVARQAQHWDPPIAWAERRHGVRLAVGAGLMHVAQDAANAPKLAAVVDPLPPLPLAALHLITTLTGSAILALAILDRHMTPHDAWTAAHVDEDWQISQWGEDAEAQARRRRRLADMEAACRLLILVNG